MGWKRGSPGCCDCGPTECLWTFVVNDLCTGAKLQGAVISVSQGGVEIATCTTTGQVISITRVNAGSNYTTPPTVTLSGGTGATATAVMRVSSLVRTSGGSGYSDGTYTGLGTFTGGGGSGATFTFTVSGGVVQPSVPIVTQGTGYTSLPTPDFSAAGPGTGAALTVRLNVLSLALLAGGSGYASATVGFSGGAGTGATGTATTAAQCTLDVPAGTYDVTVTPPVDSPYAGYSDSLVHTCSQSTTISLDVDSDNACAPNCGPCTIYPNVISVTWSGSDTGTLVPPADTLTKGPPFGTALHAWYGAATYTDPFSSTVPPGDARLVLICTPTGTLEIYSQNEDGIQNRVGLGNTFAGGTVTCSPFSVVNAFTSPGRTARNRWSLLG